MEEIYCFGGNPLDRAAERRRDEAWIASLIEQPDARLLPVRELKPAVCDGNGASLSLDWQSVGRWRDTIDSGATLVFLGLGDGGRPYFALDASTAPPDNAADTTGDASMDARALAPLLPGPEAAILGEARSVIDWHARHRYCANCGAPTLVEAAGWVRRCPECKASHYPRTDPVVIMLAVRGDYGLLGRSKRRPGNRFSCLAGFMEPGETLEEVVRRETFEEAGIRIGRVRYLASQPWPFPSTLMMGFLAEALTDEIAVDPEELAEARWFHRDEIREMVSRAANGPDDPTQVSLPQPLAIAHQICRRWSNGLDEI